MAITYPRELPSYAVSECTFELLEGVAAATYARGTRINRTQVTDPTWKVTLATPRMKREEEQLWSAWLRSLRGGMKTFRAYDAKRQRPLAYLSAASPDAVAAGWDGTATVAALTAAGSITLADLPVGYQARGGDRLGLEQAGRRGYFEILESVTANGAGGATLTLAPFIPVVDDAGSLLFTTAAVARLWQPKAEFIIDWQSWQWRGTARPESASLEAYQVL